jgi:hypothetical protein
MDFDSFFNSLDQSNIAVEVDREEIEKEHLLNNDALFQLPLICLTLLLMAKNRTKPHVSEIGQLVGECIEASMPGFKGSSQHLGWSANLRVRTVTALSFLELAELVKIHIRTERIEITDFGKKVIKRALTGDTNLAYNLLQIDRAYRNKTISKSLRAQLI